MAVSRQVLMSFWAMVLTMPAVAADVSVPVAGLKPYERPTTAPRITHFEVSADLKEKRLRGISQPWPGNVASIAEQGAWYSPMFQPGMTGRYKLRRFDSGNTEKNTSE